MPHVYMACAPADLRAARAIVNGLEFENRSVWWDERSGGAPAEPARTAEKFETAERVIVCWSRRARRSVRIRAEALEALDAGRLAQIRLDRTRPPRPFQRLPSIRFSDWDGTRGAPCWRALLEALDSPPETPPRRAAFRAPLLLADAVTGASRNATLLVIAAGLGLPAAQWAAVNGALSPERYMVAAGFLLGASALALWLAARRLAGVDATRERENRAREKHGA